MIVFYIIFGWVFFVTIGLALFELRPDRDILYKELKDINASCRYKATFAIAMFLYTPFSIYSSLKKIIKNEY